MQTTGETRDALIERDNKLLSEILEANANKKDPYWIVIFAKPSKKSISGMPTLLKHIKAYAQRPPSYVGGIIGEINNQKGTIKWEVNMPQVPFDFERLPGSKKINDQEVIVETSTIPKAYVTK